ncbi:MAG TPA: GDSL-type esterase/lipase family protein [Terriglobia bacterium]|nr:GDSL-type esterase/lipase family protein [Terriglobia bacterium]
MKRLFINPCIIAITAVGLFAAQALAQDPNRGWVTAWGTSQQTLGEAKITNATVRMIARVTISGDSIRMRLDNTFGTTPVTFGSVMAGPRIQGPAIAAGLNKAVTFGGKSSVTIPPGGSVRSDAVALRVDAQQDLAVSLFASGTNVAPSQHGNAVVTSYLTANNAGDQALSEDGKVFTGKTTAMFWLKSIDVRPLSPATVIVAFGDSITDGTCTTLDGHDRWEDIVAQRLALLTPVPRSIVNEGIGGNTVTGAHLVPKGNSPPGVDRLERDVLSHSGVSHVVLFMGTNDIRREVGADELMAGIKDIVSRIKARRIKVIGVTLIPRHNVAPVQDNTGWNDAKTGIRNHVNDWIRTKAGFDSVIDFDKIVRSPSNPDLINPPYNCGDGIHPSPIGYFQMGKSVDLGLFLGK